MTTRAFAGEAGDGRQVYTIRDDGTGLTQLTILADSLTASKTPSWGP